MGRKIWSIIGLLISWAMLSPVKNAITNLHGHTTRAAFYLVIFILGMVISWTSVMSPKIQQSQVQKKRSESYGGSSKNSGFAIASLVLGLLFFLPFANILAIVFGFIALNQIKKNNLSGKGMAITGIVLGILGIFISLRIFLSYIGGSTA